MKSTVRVAALQTVSVIGRPEENRAHAVALVEEAARGGAQLVVLPELFVPGYLVSDALWALAEPLDGPTVRWLSELSRRHNLYLGAGFAEAEGDDVFNAYAITGPDGALAGRVRKRNAEAYAFKRVKVERHVIATRLGKIGVGICADNHFVSLLRLLQDQSVDLHLMPHAWPGPVKTSKLVSSEDIETTAEKAKELPRLYATMLGAPVVLVNQVGAFHGIPGVLGRVIRPPGFQLLGLSQIIDADGSVRGALGDAEGVLIADVSLDPARKCRGMAVSHGGSVDRGSALVRDLILPIDLGLGALHYALGRGMRRRAIAESARRGMMRTPASPWMGSGSAPLKRLRLRAANSRSNSRVTFESPKQGRAASLSPSAPESYLVAAA